MASLFPFLVPLFTRTVLINLKVPSSLAPRLKLPAQLNASGAADAGDGWEMVALPLGAAWVVGVMWLLCSAWVRKQCKRREAWLTVDDFGVPLWRCATGMWTQLLVLPTLFALSLACANYSLDGWVDTAGAAWFTVNGQRFWDWCFCYVFAGHFAQAHWQPLRVFMHPGKRAPAPLLRAHPASSFLVAGYMLEDMVLLRIGPMMMIHHIGCLMGKFFFFFFFFFN